MSGFLFNAFVEDNIYIYIYICFLSNTYIESIRPKRCLIE